MTDGMEHAQKFSDARSVGIVIIGRNEGARLIACLDSVASLNAAIVYVDSGSSDGSVEAARARGAEVVALDMSKPFTAARARNAGFDQLKKNGLPDFVQFVDGDCEIVDAWIETASHYLQAHRDTAVICGRLREKNPEASLYNRLADREWDTQIGETDACGGIAMMRSSAFDDVGGFNSTLIAGEEPELCVRLRLQSWKIYRHGDDMALHDIAITSIGQWMKRMNRAGHAFAEVSSMYSGREEQIWARETKRAIFWSSLAPVSIFLGFMFTPIGFLLLLAYPLQIIRLALRDGGRKIDWAGAALSVVGKFAEARGVLQFYWQRLRGVNSKLIEYKS